MINIGKIVIRKRTIVQMTEHISLFGPMGDFDF